jgi:hypothetical protein
MRALTKKHPTNQVEVRFMGTPTNIIKLRRIAKSLKIKDLTEWDLE